MKALISVSDRSGLPEFARALVDLGYELYATAGTEAALREAGVPAQSVGKLTDFPEILGGRVKTLHPAIYGGILADRRQPTHMAELDAHKLALIDLVVVSLYPFRRSIETPGTSLEEAVEQIDIGGVSLLRAGAKNFASVTTVCDPADYADVIEHQRRGTLDLDRRRRLAAKAFEHVAAYDALIAGYLRGPFDTLPESLTLALTKVKDLRYGENPHQRGALYEMEPLAHPATTLAGARQINGKALSFTNLLDVDNALSTVRDFAAITVAVVKHGSPCGLACADELPEAYQRAHAGDPISAFGGAVGLNRIVDRLTASLIGQTFYEDVIAPGYTDEALAILRQKRNLRLLEVDFSPISAELAATNPLQQLDFKRISGGFLVQSFDRTSEDDLSLTTVSEREPTLEELTNLIFAWRAVKHVKSNAIALAMHLSLVGVGTGQPSRVDSVKIAAQKAGDRSIGSVLASDAFFPKPDGIEAAAMAGVTAIIQPGGSIRDDDAIREANKHHVAMLVTGRRHFRH